jgi:hypothetical protein
MTTQNIFDLSDTWNDGATTFSAIKMNVTDTASASGSLLMDLQVGGSSKFSVSKSGQVTVHDGSNTAPSIRGTDVDSGIYFFGNNIRFTADGNNRFSLDSLCNLNLSSVSAIRWSNSGSDANAGHDTILSRDAADTLAQRRSTNPQAFRVYGTYTDGSNYERGKIAWESNVLRIGTENAGTGSARALELQVSGVTFLKIDTSGHAIVTLGRQLFLGANGVNWQQLDNQMRLNGGPLEMVERTAPSAPAANGVRIYAEDDGSGKTRLMALFATGAAQQIAIEP